MKRWTYRVSIGTVREEERNRKEIGKEKEAHLNWISVECCIGLHTQHLLLWLDPRTFSLFTVIIQSAGTQVYLSH